MENTETARLKRRLLGRVQIDPATGCWLWQGALNRQGYGRIMDFGQRCSAHRAAYAAFIGPISSGNHIHHRCQNKSCINPAHLAHASPRDHLRLHPDQLTTVNAQKSHCTHGHEFTPENRYWPAPPCVVPVVVDAVGDPEGSAVPCCGAVVNRPADHSFAVTSFRGSPP